MNVFPKCLHLRENKLSPFYIFCYNQEKREVTGYVTIYKSHMYSSLPHKEFMDDVFGDMDPMGEQGGL